MLILALSLTVLMVCGILLVWTSQPAAPTDPTQTQTQPQMPTVQYQLVISEICGKNNTIIADADGRNRDYIELYNAGETISLAGLSLSDGKTISQPFGDIVLEKGSYTLIFLANELTGFAIG